MQNDIKKSTLIFVFLFIFSLVSSLPIFAETESGNMIFDYEKTAENLGDYLVEEKPDFENLIGNDRCKVKIFNNKNDLVRFGKADDEMVRNMVLRSDFLIKVDNTQYYILYK